MRTPGKDVNEVYELLPKYDCGLCGNPRCMTFARKLLLDDQKSVECQFLSTDNIQRISEIASEEVVRKHTHPNEDEDIIEISPCTEDGYVTLETQLRSKIMVRDLFSDFFDQYQLCISLSEVDDLESMNCSSKMGYALVENKGKRTHVFKTGRIIMRRADDREDALHTLGHISRMLMSARLCSCQNTLVDCFGGACENCINGSCAALIDATEVKEGYDKDGITIGEVLKEFDNKGIDRLSGNFGLLTNIVSELQKIDKAIRAGNEIQNENYTKTTDKYAGKISKTCMEVMRDNSDLSNTIVALAQYGIARDLIRARDGLLSLKENKDMGLYDQAARLLFDGFSSFESRDYEKSEKIQKDYLEFISSIKGKSVPFGLFKVAANGFYISRVLGKPVPH
jgi:ArsR family metal-binding transcriptional regulator